MYEVGDGLVCLCLELLLLLTRHEGHRAPSPLPLPLLNQTHSHQLSMRPRDLLGTTDSDYQILKKGICLAMGVLLLTNVCPLPV